MNTKVSIKNIVLDESTTPELLIALLEITTLGTITSEAIATPDLLDALAKIVQSHTGEYAEGDIAGNIAYFLGEYPNTHASVLEVLANSVDLEGEVIEFEAKHRWEVINLVVKHPNTPSHVLEELSIHGSGELMEWVAKHPNTDPVFLAELARSRNSYDTILILLANNPNTPEETLTELDDMGFKRGVSLREHYKKNRV